MTVTWARYQMNGIVENVGEVVKFVCVCVRARVEVTVGRGPQE